MPRSIRSIAQGNSEKTPQGELPPRPPCLWFPSGAPEGLAYRSARANRPRARWKRDRRIDGGRCGCTAFQPPLVVNRCAPAPDSRQSRKPADRTRTLFVPSSINIEGLLPEEEDNSIEELPIPLFGAF